MRTIVITAASSGIGRAAMRWPRRRLDARAAGRIRAPSFIPVRPGKQLHIWARSSIARAVSRQRFGRADMAFTLNRARLRSLSYFSAELNTVLPVFASDG
jgi:hypothetical protein